MSVAACAGTRARLTRALDGPVEAEISAHISECPGCASEFAAHQAAVVELSTARSEPPDPGQQYWEAFLPKVRGRITYHAMVIQRPPGRRLSVAAAAALLMLASAATILMLPGGVQSGPQEVALRRLDALLASTPSGHRIVADLLVSMEDIPGERLGVLLRADFTLEPDDVLDALEVLDAHMERPGDPGLWDEGMEGFVDRLDADGAAALRVELARENG